MSGKRKKKMSRAAIVEDRHAAWSTMPDEFLKDKYRELKKKQKFWAAPPLLLLIPGLTIYGIMGWADYFAAEYQQFTVSFFSTKGIGYPILFAVCSAYLSDKEVRGLYKAPVFFAFATGLYIGLTDEFITYTPLMFLYLLLAAVMISPIVRDLNFLRSLPSFPFDSRRENMDLSGMSREQVLRNLEASARGQVLSGLGEEVLTADDPAAAADPPENTEDYLQQHKVIYRNRDPW